MPICSYVLLIWNLISKTVVTIIQFKKLHKYLERLIGPAIKQALAALLSFHA